ncbi:MAG: cobyric acid synthase [Treponema sp.]|nr:cobyric acid synthase [Treponema sp.]
MSHGGSYSDKFDFSANINPLGLHPAAQQTIASLALRTEKLTAYPDSDCAELRELIARFWSDSSEKSGPLCAEQVVCGAGAVDLIFMLTQLCPHPDEKLNGKISIVEPAFTEYERAAKANGFQTRHFLLSEQNGFSFTKKDVHRLEAELDEVAVLFMASPANPSGAVADGELLCQIAELCERGNIFFVMDACFCQFSESAERGVRTLISRHEEYPHTIVLNAFTKFYGMAGLRLGYTICFSSDTAVSLKDRMRPWAVSADAQQAGIAVLKAELAEKNADETMQSRWEKNTYSLVSTERIRLVTALQTAGFSVVEGDVNFILFRDTTSSGGSLNSRLLSHGIAIRSCADFYGLNKNWYRIAVRTPSENTQLISALSSLYSPKAITTTFSTENSQSLRSKTATFMVQGTMSNAGKSLLVAALCRIFRQDGYNVAPFKSQNMALNSGVTADELEMGRAQIMQAEAAGLFPDVRMNPILLKPCGETGSQVIINGVPTGTMSAKDYFSYRKTLIPYIMDSYHSLAAENDIIVIEGAGSPVEINLKKDDIVNMGLAELTDSPVLLVGDIDRGGVFASLYGTIALLEPNERKRVKGFIINKFRGDVSLLQDGLDQIRDLTGIPVLGVVPFMPNLLIDDEDSLSEQLSMVEQSRNYSKQDALLHIAVVRLPYISNFTDLQTFSRLPFVQVSFFANLDDYAACVTEYGEPDMFVLPGTKNTVHALQWLREQRLDRLIVRKAKSGVPAVGICGGFQLLGMVLHDGEGNEDESAQNDIPALGLLPVETHFTAEKTRVQVSAKLPSLDGLFAPLSGCEVSGYEIHHGKTQFVPGAETAWVAHALQDNAERMPLACVEGNVLGTYVHGFFDSEEISHALITMLCERKGISAPAYESYKSAREAEYDRLASVVRASLDMDAVYKIVFGKSL